MRPWEHDPPPILYKYLGPDRLDVLINCRIRFSQRTAFHDDHELQPDYASFGSEGEIWEMLLYHQILHPESKPIAPGMSLPHFVELVARDPRLQERVKQIAISSMKSPDEMGVLCLTANADSTDMWNEYAADGTGFVLGFQTGHPGFESLSTPGKLGKVDYSDEPFGSYLGAAFDHGAGTFYRKRMNYACEQEWRCIRMLKQLERNAGEIYLAQLDPAAIQGIVITDRCSIQVELRHLVQEDYRYQHLEIAIRGQIL
ncbi:MAG TPA: DUF2971 domain-containing protein [Terriglobales bacterium]|jgi:hypothetical protein|nr:DUF2971 domain-containing protein [Terriglobales bacterium]